VFVYLNGRIIPSHQAVISIFDHGFLYGDGVYETIRVLDGFPFLLDEHLLRLAQSARALRLGIPVPFPDIKKVIQTLIRKNHFPEASIRITLTRGPGPYGFDPRPCRNPTLAISCSSFVGYPASYYRRGITAALVGVKRNHPLSLPPSVKSTSCLNGILAKIESIDLGAQEAIMSTLDDRIAEGTVSNVFAVKKNRIFTPVLGKDLLPGVTRDFVCRLARSLGLEVVEKELSINDLKTSKEIFLTSTLMNILPVTKLVWVANRKIKSIKMGVGMGPVTRILAVCFEKAARAGKWYNSPLKKF